MDDPFRRPDVMAMCELVVSRREWGAAGVLADMLDDLGCQNEAAALRTAGIVYALPVYAPPVQGQPGVRTWTVRVAGINPTVITSRSRATFTAFGPPMSDPRARVAVALAEAADRLASRTTTAP